MKTAYTVYRNETLIGIVPKEEVGWDVVGADIENRKNNETFSMSDDYRVEKIYIWIWSADYETQIQQSFRSQNRNCKKRLWS